MFKYLFYSLLADSTDEAGAYGEMMVSSVSALKKYKELNCHLFKDVYINGPDRVNQIDHIFVMRTGIFLVETKMFYYGRVIGKDDEEIWVDKVEDRVTPFLNPIIQNESHERALRKLIRDKYKIIPLVVFAWNNKPRSTTDPYVLNYKNSLISQLTIKVKTN